MKAQAMRLERRREALLRRLLEAPRRTMQAAPCARHSTGAARLRRQGPACRSTAGCRSSSRRRRSCIRRTSRRNRARADSGRNGRCGRSRRPETPAFLVPSTSPPGSRGHHSSDGVSRRREEVSSGSASSPCLKVPADLHRSDIDVTRRDVTVSVHARADASHRIDASREMKWKQTGRLRGAHARVRQRVPSLSSAASSARAPRKATRRNVAGTRD